MKHVLLTFVLCLSLAANSQSIKSFQYAPDSLMEAGSCKILKSGYIVTGKYYAGGSQVNYAVRYNNNGSVKWTRQESIGAMRLLADVTEDENNNLFFLAEDASGDEHYVVIKTDSLGNFIWSTNISKNWYASYGSPRLMPDGNGSLYVLSSTYDKTHLYKLSTATGYITWSRTFYLDVITDKNPGFDIVLTGDGGVICTGKADVDIFMVCVSPNGDLVWSKRMNDFGNTYAHAKAITRLHNGNYLMAGFRGETNAPYYSGMFLLEIDSLGTILDYKFYYDSTGMQNFLPESIHELNNGIIRVMGNGGPVTYADFDASFNLLTCAYWPAIMNAQTSSNCFDMVNNSLLITCADREDKQYVLLSQTGANVFCQSIEINAYAQANVAVNESVYTSDIHFEDGPGFVYSTNPLYIVTSYAHDSYCEIVETSLSTEEITAVNEVSVYPNPAKGGDVLKVELSQHSTGKYTLLNTTGQVLTQGNYSGMSTTIILPQNAPGVYFVRLDDAGANWSKTVKLVVE